jgi:hypothetical protein
VDRAHDQDHNRVDVGRRGDAAQPLLPTQVAAEQVRKAAALSRSRRAGRRGPVRRLGSEGGVAEG